MSFENQMPQVKSDLREKGYAVIKGFFNNDETSDFYNSFSDIYTKLMYKDKKGKIQHPLILHGGMIQYIGHSQVQWDIRLKAKPMFQALFNTDNLFSSFDGFCYMIGKKPAQRVELDSFLHRDQDLSDVETSRIQGLINLTQNLSSEQGGFVCIPKSHLIKSFSFFPSIRQSKKDWYLFSKLEKNILSSYNYNPEFIPLDKGDFLLWDSRLLHCNTKCYDRQSMRVCSYVSMFPKEKLKTILEQKYKTFFEYLLLRERIFNERRCQGASLFPSCLFPKIPRFSADENLGDKIKEICDFDETDEILNLSYLF